jgi:integrase
MAKTSEVVKLTKRVVEAAQPLHIHGAVRQKVYFDTELRGFGLCVGATAKTFIVQRDVNGRTARVKIDRYPVITVEQARREAQQLLAKMGRGISPVEEKRAAKARGVTLREALNAYEETLKAKRRSPKTIHGYRYAIETYLKDWLARPLAEISRADVRAKHKKICADVAKGRYADGRDRSDSRGERTANAALVAFRAVWNSAMRVHELLPPAPTIAVDWYKTEQRKSALPLSELHKWAAAVAKIENPVRRDLLRYMLLTGLRRTNACETRWEQTDLEAEIVHVPKPKSGRPFDLPLSDRLIELLAERKRKNDEAFGEDCPWVFPSATAASGHIEEPREKFDGIAWTPHDLRRWYITTAESLDVSPLSIKMLVNHRVPGDITARYLQTEVERLRPVQQAITDKLVALCTPPDGKVKALPRLRDRKESSTTAR